MDTQFPKIQQKERKHQNEQMQRGIIIGNVEHGSDPTDFLKRKKKLKGFD